MPAEAQSCCRGRTSKELIRRKASWRRSVEGDGPDTGNAYPSLHAHPVIAPNAILRSNSMPPVNVLRQLQQQQQHAAELHPLPKRTWSTLHGGLPDKPSKLP